MRSQNIPYNHGHMITCHPGNDPLETLSWMTTLGLMIQNDNFKWVTTSRDRFHQLLFLYTMFLLP